MDIQKIERPENGWTKEKLEQYGFTFYSQQIAPAYLNLTILLLNKNLPYFYCTHSKYYKFIFIQNNFINDLHKASRRNYFDKNILNYIISYKEYEDEQDIAQTMQNLDYKQEQYLEKKRKEEEEYKKQQEEYRQKYYKQQEYKQRQREQNKLKNEQKNNIPYQKEDGGIYGIYSRDGNNDTQLLYIGLTTRPVNQRLQEHKDILDGKEEIPKGMNRLYELLNSEYRKKHLEAKVLISFADMDANRALSRSEKEAMEMALIHYFHPPGNTSGITIPYRFSDFEIK